MLVGDDIKTVFCVLCSVLFSGVFFFLQLKTLEFILRAVRTVFMR